MSSLGTIILERAFGSTAFRLFEIYVLVKISKSVRPEEANSSGFLLLSAETRNSRLEVPSF